MSHETATFSGLDYDRADVIAQDCRLAGGHAHIEAAPSGEHTVICTYYLPMMIEGGAGGLGHLSLARSRPMPAVLGGFT